MPRFEVFPARMEHRDSLPFRAVHTPVMLFLWLSTSVTASVEFPGRPSPTAAQCSVAGDSIVLQNEVIRQAWSLAGSKLAPASLADKLSSTSVLFQASEIFEFEQGSVRYPGTAFQVLRKPAACSTVAAKGALDVKLANRTGGKAVTALLQSQDAKFQVEWSAVLLDGSNYIRQSVRVTNKSGAPALINKFTYLRQNALAPAYQGNPIGPQSPETGSGRGYGSTIGDGPFFFGLEAGYASNLISSAGGRKEISFYIPSVNPLPPGGSNAKWFVTGVAPAGQMRRAFLYYISRERSHYYRMYPHYDAWYDLTFAYREDSLLNRIQVFGRELGRKRGFYLKAYQADDGWDDANRSPPWMHFNGGLLPRGYSVLKDSAAKYQAAMGLWFGVAGGYGGRAQRIAASAALGVETLRSSVYRNETFLTMSGPNYYRAAFESFKDKIQNHGVKVIKYDVMMLHTVDTAFYEHMDAIGAFNDDLRKLDPDLFLKGMGGTLASPFYLMQFDAYFRGGNGDSGNLGTPWSGTNPRETWINFRDAVAYDDVTIRSTVCPLNSIALHGITIGPKLYPANWPRDLASVKHEVRSFFGVGSQVQDLLISPHHMTDSIYDVIAEAGKWALSNEDIMEDTHWVGGNIRNGEVYGYASWNRRGGTLSLRNPKTTSQSISLDIGKAFELPDGVAGVGRTYELRSPWKEDASKPALILVAGTPHTFALQGLETVQFNARPTDVTGVRGGPRREAASGSQKLVRKREGWMVESRSGDRAREKLEIRTLDGRKSRELPLPASP